MNWYTNLFSAETYEAFSRGDRTVSGFRATQESSARRISAGDRLVCYMTGMSRWIGVLEVTGRVYTDDSPLFLPEDDPFVVRLPVRELVWLTRSRTIPIHAALLWDALTFTRGRAPSDPGWTGLLRRSLNELSEQDGRVLEQALRKQEANGVDYPLDENKYKRLLTRPIRRADKIVSVTVPSDDDIEDATTHSASVVDSSRESHDIQGILASIGEAMGFKIWLPRNDRSNVLRGWTPGASTLIDALPLNYDDTTLQTIEQIDVLWLRNRSIVRAFEVEHTTAVYSGILRMADLLALQPNMDIRLHLVAPEGRREKVFSEIRRPVFSLLDRAPLSECCTFISYDSLRELSNTSHLTHMTDSVLDEYAEHAE